LNGWLTILKKKGRGSNAERAPHRLGERGAIVCHLKNRLTEKLGKRALTVIASPLLRQKNLESRGRGSVRRGKPDFIKHGNADTEKKGLEQLHKSLTKGREKKAVD